MRTFRFIPDNTRINFLRARWVCLGFSLFFFLGTLGLLATRGLNYGIDFAGGTLVEVKVEKALPISEVRDTLQTAGMGSLVIQQYGAPDDILIRMPGVQTEENASATISNKISGALGARAGKVEIRRVEYVGPQVGGELKEKGLLAIVLSAIAILIYVSIRFEFRFAVGAVVALIHDVMLTIGIFSLLQKEISMPVLAALLTILGYSLNDTIVVFDRVRENMRKFKKRPLAELLNLSINEMLNRTLMMSLTTLIVLVALFIWGGEVIHDFAFALLFGVLVGTYSSTYIASPVVLWLAGVSGSTRPTEAQAKAKADDEAAE